MSINISLDKNKLASVICPLCQQQQPSIPKYLGFQALGLWPSQDMENWELSYKGGWLFAKYSGQQFAAVEVDRVHVGDLQTNQGDGVFAVIWLGELSDFFFIFTETTKAQYDTYTGMMLYKDGHMEFVSNPENISEQILSAGSIKAGDILLVGLYFLNDNGQLKVEAIVAKWDYASDSVTSLVDKWYNLSQRYPWKTGYVVEPMGQPCYYGIAGAWRGNRRPLSDYVHYLKMLGLADPNEVKPW